MNEQIEVSRIGPYQWRAISLGPDFPGVSCASYRSPEDAVYKLETKMQKSIESVGLWWVRFGLGSALVAVTLLATLAVLSWIWS